jgi:hypothetical protein
MPDLGSLDGQSMRFTLNWAIEPRQGGSIMLLLRRYVLPKQPAFLAAWCVHAGPTGRLIGVD